MATAKFRVPNWSQKLIIEAIGVNPDSVTIRNENDRNISFIVHQPRPNKIKEYIVNKLTGEYVSS